MSSTKSQTLLVGYWLFSAVILLAVIELLLVFFWNNPYRLSNSHPVYTRFHPSKLLAYAAIHDRLYSGEYRVRIYVEPDMSISSGSVRNDTAAICIGGSTTESALVPEGQRWPDLLQLPAKNFGVSGSTSIDGYFNLKYLIESAGAKPQAVFLMFAVNDLRAFLSKGAEGFTIEGWNEPMGNALVEIDSIDDHVLFGLRIRDSALLSFIRYEANNIRGREFFNSYYAQRQAQAELSVLSDGEFRGLFDAFVDDFLPRRKRVYEEIDRVARTHETGALFTSPTSCLHSRLQPVSCRPAPTSALARQENVVFAGGGLDGYA